MVALVASPGFILPEDTVNSAYYLPEVIPIVDKTLLGSPPTDASKLPLDKVTPEDLASGFNVAYTVCCEGAEASMAVIVAAGLDNPRYPLGAG